MLPAPAVAVQPRARARLAGERDERAGAKTALAATGERAGTLRTRDARGRGGRSGATSERGQMTDQRGRGRVARGEAGGGLGTTLAAARPASSRARLTSGRSRPGRRPGVTPLAWLRAELAAVLAQRPQATATGAHLRAFLGELAGLEDAEQLRVDLGVLKALVATVEASLDRDDPHALEAIHQWLATLAAEGPLDMTDARDAGPSALLDRGP